MRDSSSASFGNKTGHYTICFVVGTTPVASDNRGGMNPTSTSIGTPPLVVESLSMLGQQGDSISSPSTPTHTTHAMGAVCGTTPAGKYTLQASYPQLPECAAGIGSPRLLATLDNTGENVPTKPSSPQQLQRASDSSAAPTTASLMSPLLQDYVQFAMLVNQQGETKAAAVISECSNASPTTPLPSLSAATWGPAFGPHEELLLSPQTGTAGSRVTSGVDTAIDISPAIEGDNVMCDDEQHVLTTLK